MTWEALKALSAEVGVGATIAGQRGMPREKAEKQK